MTQCFHFPSLGQLGRLNKQLKASFDAFLNIKNSTMKKTLFALLFVATGFAFSQTDKFSEYLGFFPQGASPYVCCVPFSQKIEDEMAKEFIYSQKIASKFGLYEDSGYQFGHIIHKNSTHIVLVVNQVNSLWRNNRQVVLVYDAEKGLITDVILASGRKLLAPMNGVEQYEDYSFVFDKSEKLVLKDALYMVTDDGVRKADENEQVFQLNPTGVFVKSKRK